jgi:predicted NBD/HSP70 family sugar kinase
MMVPLLGAIVISALSALLKKNDRARRSIFEECRMLLGVAVANLVSLFDPQVVVIRGGLASAPHSSHSDPHCFLNPARMGIESRIYGKELNGV